MTRPGQTRIKVREEKELEETLRLDEIHNTFIRNVSHELRTPLAVLMGYADLLHNGELGALSPEQRQAVSIIANRTEELRKTVTRIDTLLAVQANKYLQQPLTLPGLVTQAVEAQRRRAEAAGLTLELHLSTDLPRIIGDGEQLQLAFECVIENAIKFTPRGGHIIAQLWADPQGINLSVADTGIGIAQEDIARLFTPFAQLDDSPSRSYGGLGLGLTLVHSIVAAHKGVIAVESELGQGSRFTIKLPSCPSLEKPLATVKGTGPRRILIVDDEECVAFTLREGLRKLPQCEIVVSLSGLQALKLFEEQPFDLLITDYKMPDLNGVALASHINQIYPGTGIIMITAYGHDLVQDPVAARAIQKVLHKPIRLKEIRDVALETLALHEKSEMRQRWSLSPPQEKG